MYNLKDKDERPNEKLLWATAGDTFSASQAAAIAPYATFIDMFQSYADTSALVTAWVESDTGETDAAVTVTAGEFGYGNQGMAITTTAGKDDQTITDTITSANFTSHTVYVLAKSSLATATLLLYLSDGTEAGSAEITFAAKDTFEWQSFACNSTIFVKDATHGAGNDVDLTAVTGIGFAVKDASTNPTMKVNGVVVLPATETYRMYKADANGIARTPMIGTAPPYAATAGTKYDFPIFTNIVATSAVTLIPGLLVYLTGTAGTIAQFFSEAVGFTRQPIGIAISSTEYLVYSPGGEF